MPTASNPPLSPEVAPIKGSDAVTVPIETSLVKSLSKPFEAEADYDLGSLSRLPPELLFVLCRELDVRSCITLRQVNRCARETISSLVEYRAVTKHALHVVQAVLWSGMGPRVTFPDLYRLLCTHECMICSFPDSSDSFRFYDSRAPKNRPKIAPGVKGLEAGRAALQQAIADCPKDGTVLTPSKKRPTALTVLSMQQDAEGKDDIVDWGETTAGVYLFLPTLTRCCKACLEESPRLRIVPMKQLRIAADIPRRHFLPLACTPWHIEKKAAPKSKTKAKGKQTKAKTAHMENKLSAATITQGDAARLLFDAGFTSKRVKEVLYASGHLGQFCWWDEVAMRADFTVRLPFLDQRTSTAGSGYTCRGCDAVIQKMYGHLEVQLEYTNTVFSTKAAFLAHFDVCPYAMELWKKETKRVRERRA
ncbi:hypothetical protein SEUCBS139899_009230 [Sporothrix eucalyptigena]